MCAMRIGDIAEKTGTAVATIRYYESIGLMPTAARNRAGQRRYGPPDTARLRFILSRRALGFSLRDIAALIRDSGPGSSPCAAARDAATRQPAALRARQTELAQIQADLLRQIDACTADCMQDLSPDCRLVLP